MKKTLTSFFFSIILFSSTFAYFTPSELQDYQQVNEVLWIYKNTIENSNAESLINKFLDTDYSKWDYDHMITDLAALVLEISKKDNNDLWKYIFEEVVNKDTINWFKSNDTWILNQWTNEILEDNLRLFYRIEDWEELTLAPYVDFESYIQNFQKTFAQWVHFYHDDENKTWKIEYDLDYDGNPENIIFDFKNNKISLSDMKMVASISNPNSSESKINESLAEIYSQMPTPEIISKTQALEIDLSKYNLELSYDNDTELVPFHLLLFLIWSYDTQLMFNWWELIYGTLRDMQDWVPITEWWEDIELSPKFIEYSANVEELIFDNFYGLQEIKANYIDNLKAIRNSDDYIKAYKDFVIGLEDRHTAVYDFLYWTDMFKFTDKELEAMKAMQEESAIKWCDPNADTIVVNKLNEETVVVEINDYMLPTFVNDYFETINSIRDYKNIVLDLSCNGGGIDEYINVTLYPFTDDQLVFSNWDINGGQFRRTYTKSEYWKTNMPLITDANLYVLTSKSTFSSWNYAAVRFRETGLATLIWENSWWWSAAIILYTLPNGAIMSMSFGSYLLFDSNRDLVEKWAGVDIPFEFTSENKYDKILETIDNNS